MSHHILFSLILLLGLPLTLNAQEEVQSDGGVHEEDTYTTVEEMPEFPGGEQELFHFLSRNIEYPDLALKARIHGVVYVTFVIDADGLIKEAEILRGIGGGCDEESLRVVNLMPAWEPGKHHGNNVRVRYNLPIRYTLRKKNSKKR